MRVSRGFFTATLLAACASVPQPLHYDLFVAVAEGDAYAPAIQHWQAESRLEDLSAEVAELRAKLSGNALPPPGTGDAGAGVTPLGQAYRGFQSALRRDVVDQTVHWVQQQSGLYYQNDGDLDDWPVLGELLAAGADDCDGMDLLTFSLLRGLGFEQGEIYRAIVRNVRSDLHHIVTLWFEAGRRDDPWLLDSTGEISRAVRPLSAHRDWEPLRLFDERTSFAARRR